MTYPDDSGQRPPSDPYRPSPGPGSQPPGATPPGYPPLPAYPQPSAYTPPPGPPNYPPSAGGYSQQPPYQAGYPIAPYSGGYGAPHQGTNGLAIGSLVASLVGLPFAFFCFGIFGAIGAIVGVVLGIVALNQIKQTGQEGRGLAIGGISVGGAVLAIALIVMVAASIYVANN